MAYGHQAISPYPSFDHDKGIIWDFRMTEVSLSLTRVNKAYSISATGSLKLWDGIAARTSVVKTTDLRGNTDILSFTGSGEIFIDKSEIPNMVHHFTGLDLPKAIANVLVIDSVAISGSLNANSYIGTWFAIKLLGDDARVAMILRDKYPYHHDHMHTGVASELFANISFSEFYPGEMDVSGVPYFGSAIAEDVTYLKLSTEERVCNLPHGMLDDVLLFVPECIEGTNIKAAFSDSIIPYTFRDGTDDVENTSYKKNGSMYEYSGMIGSVGKSAPKLHSYPVNTAITLREVLKIYAPELDLDEMNRNHYFFFDIRTVYNLGILKLTLAPDSESDYLVCIDVIDNKAMSFFFNFLVIDHSDMKFCLTQEKTLDVSVTGEIAIGDVNFEATVEKTGDDYTISARANKLDITDILSHFHAQFLPQDLREVLKNSPFGDFAVENPFIVYQFSSNTSDDKYLQIGGTPSISGYEILDIDAILVHHNTTSDLAGGIFIQSVKLEALFFDITQMSLKGIPMLDQNVNASIVISPATIDHALEEHPDTTIHKGISIEVDMGFPDDCSSNVFCKTIRKLLGEDTHFAVTGTFANSGEFSVSALVENINLGHGYELESAGLKIMVGEDSNSIGITGTLHIEDPALTFSGEIEMATEGVEVQLSMSGCWNHPFHIKLLTICNIEGSIALEPELPVFPSELGIGGELKLGNPDCSKPFIAKGYVGINAVTPSNNYFYVDFSKVTIGSLLKAFFCWNADKLPRPIQETGFPEGFMSSYSENEIDLPNITIPIGFHLKGVLDILGLRGSADIDIDWSAQKFDIDVKIPPINIGNGMLKMFRSPDNHLQGPYLSANMTFPDSVKIAASGYVEVLGSTEYATLEVTDDSYRFTYTAKVLNLFKAHLEISALYKRPLTDVSFEVKGYFENDLMEAIENFIKNTFDKAVNDAKEKIKEAEADVESKKQALEDAKGKLEEDKRKVDDAYGAFRAADDSLEAAKRKVASALSRCRKLYNTSNCIATSPGLSLPPAPVPNITQRWGIESKGLEYLIAEYTIDWEIFQMYTNFFFYC